MKIKKRDTWGNIPAKTFMLGNNTIIGPSNTVRGTKFSSKRKVWDTDVIMEDSVDDLKRSCAGDGVLVVVSDISVLQVAGVGGGQPREHQ